MPSDTKTATFYDKTHTGFRWECEAPPFALESDEIGTQSTGAAVAIAVRLVAAGFAVTVLSDGPGSSEIRAAVRGA